MWRRGFPGVPSVLVERRDTSVVGFQKVSRLPRDCETKLRTPDFVGAKATAEVKMTGTSLHKAKRSPSKSSEPCTTASCPVLAVICG